MSDVNNILALDVGDARVGVALANSIAKLPSPLAIIDNDRDVWTGLIEIIDKNDVNTVVVGLPRNMEGEETAQSRAVRDFAGKLAEATDKKIVFADESLSSKRAEDHSPKKKYLDDIAACFILEEYLQRLK